MVQSTRLWKGYMPTAQLILSCICILAICIVIEKRFSYQLGHTQHPKIFEIELDALQAQGAGSNLLTLEMKNLYKKEGVIAIRGLISNELLDRLYIASDKLIANKGKRRRGSQFHTVVMGAVFLDPPSPEQYPDCSDKEHNDLALGETCGIIQRGEKNTSKASSSTNDLSAFREVALQSIIPSIVAEFLGIQSVEKGKNLHMLRDVFLAKDSEQHICGWHVDDYGFWPATPSSDGINAWIALDDMPIEYGGGFALSPGSHNAEWRFDAYKATGSTYTYPTEGYKNAADMFSNRPGAGTCNMKSAAPEINRKMEETKRVYDVKRGDVIFHNRWLFHRTMPFKIDATGHQKRDTVYARYSIRYAPGSAQIPKGYGTELSVLYDDKNGGRTLDEVSLLDGPWYPKCWPQVDNQEMSRLAPLLDKMHFAEVRLKERKKEMQPYLKRIGEQNRRRQSQMQRNRPDL